MSITGAARVAGIMGRLLAPLAEYDYKTPPDVLGEYEASLERILEIFEPAGAARVPVADRIKAADALGQGGDPRIGHRRENLLPIPTHPGTLLGKYPVTVQEYQEFVDGRGYELLRAVHPGLPAESDAGEFPPADDELFMVMAENIDHLSLRFMSEDHHRIRDYAVMELSREGAPLAAETIARALDLDPARVHTLLDELESHLTFLVRNERGEVTWAYPVTVDQTPHRVTFSTGEQVNAA